MKKQTITMLFLLLAGFCTANAQAVVSVTLNSGTTTDYTVSADGAIYFNDDNMLVRTAAGAETTSIAMSDVRNIRFTAVTDTTSSEDTTTTSIEHPLAESNNWSLYPNPTAETVVVIGLGSGIHTMTIYNLNGRVVMKATVTDGQPINIAPLPQGIYMVNVNNANRKLIKL